MSDLKKFERIRMLSLTAIFVCSTLLFFSFFIRILYSWNHVRSDFPHEDAYLISIVALVVIMSVIALWRLVRLRMLMHKEPSLRSLLEDERVNFDRLKAYRLAFFVLLIIQVASKGPGMIWPAPWEVPCQSQISLSAAVMTSTGAFLFYSIWRKHE